MTSLRLPTNVCYAEIADDFFYLEYINVNASAVFFNSLNVVEPCWHPQQLHGNPLANTKTSVTPNQTRLNSLSLLLYNFFLPTNCNDAHFIYYGKTIKMISNFYEALGLAEPGLRITGIRFDYIILFISTWHHNITNEWKSFLSLLSERREMRVSENAILGLGVGSNPGPLAPESCVLPCAIQHY